MQVLLDLINNIAEAATGTATAVKSAASTASAVKTFFASPETPSNPELEGLITDLVSQIYETKIANFELKEKLLTLQEEAMKQKKLQDQFERYSLWETPAGAFVYRLKEANQEGEPIHYLCATCLEQGKRSILQGHSEARECHTCKKWFRFKESTFDPPPIPRGTGRWA